MADPAAVRNALHGIAARVDEGMSEQDVENAFLNEGFYDALGYEGAGYDLRSEWTLPDDRRPDYVTLDDNEAVTAVYEFKTTGRDLGPHEDQLFHYVDTLKADYGVLTNGEELRVYDREDRDRLLSLPIADASESDARDLTSALDKPEWDITDPGSVSEYFVELDPVALDDDLGQDHFFDTFRLEEGSPFADLVTASMDLLVELRDERGAPFVEGAYDFWEASYASAPDEIPDSWKPFTNGRSSLMDFMFCLESGHALLARLLLAKATEDHDFFPPTRGLRRYFDELRGFSSNIDLDAYPVAATGLLEDMHDQLVQSLFEDDIFIWWTDAFEEETARQHANPYNRFQEVAREGSQITRVSQATKERFSRAVAHVLFSVLKFDFSAVEGDPLGDLYQRYFDPETRKALGEFYTPQPVIDYIMDGVGYDAGVSNERLIDPSCGSGTFLVEAVERYLADVRRYEDDPDWEEHLTELCSRPHVVGLDIHPFAVLMAQIRFMVAILPEYREAKRQNPEFTIRRLPIFRTDSLQNEREATGADLGDDGWRQLTFQAMTEDNQDVLIPVPLPIEVDEPEDSKVETDGGFLVRRVRMPLFDTIQLETGVSNFGEYFAALQGVLDVVKFHMAEDEWEYVGGLREGIDRYASREYEGIETFFEPYVDEILETARYLRDEHGDGRLFKMFEDSMLALVVKNYMTYDYVVGNPPYVRIQHLPDEQKAYLDDLYDSTTGNYDLYCPFYERGLDWLRDESSILGYVTSNQFMVTNYGTGLRRVLSDRATIQKVCDFRDVPLFESATNYPAVLFLSSNPDGGTENEIRCIRLRGDVDRSDPELTETVMNHVRRHEGSPGHGGEYVDVFEYPQERLDEGYWSLCPPVEREVLDKLRRNCELRAREVTEAIFHGTQPGWNKVYVVTPVDADRISAEDSGDVVTVVPRGESKEYEIETDLLRPWLQGRDVHRWQCEWTGQHVILPYEITKTDDGIDARVHSPDYLQEHLPKTWQYLKSHEDVLKSRENGMMEDRADWYAFTYPKSHQRFELPKIVGRQFSDRAQFMLDTDGDWYFKGAYGIQLESGFQSRTRELCCQLNSKAVDFHVKHIATQKQGGYYAYRKQYVGESPCFVAEQDGFDGLRSISAEIIETLDLETKVQRFPEAYLGDFTGQLEYVDHEWQTRRYPVNATVREQDDGLFAVEAGRTDSIAAPQLDTEERARYVHAAVDGRNVGKGEETSIPIPKRDEDVRTLLEELEADRESVENTDIVELEAEIDRIVYDLFELTDEEREVVEEYHEVF